MNHSIASAVFDSEAEADRAVQQLRRAGVPDSALSIIAQQDGRTTTTTGGGDTGDNADSSIIRGLIGGGALGAGLGVAALAIPGVGPLVAFGAIAASAIPEAVAIGAVAGAFAGSMNESLQKHGIAEDDASYYGDRIKGGATLVSVDDSATALSAGYIREILYDNGGHSASRARAAPVM